MKHARETRRLLQEYLAQAMSFKDRQPLRSGEGEAIAIRRTRVPRSQSWERSPRPVILPGRRHHKLEFGMHIETVDPSDTEHLPELHDLMRAAYAIEASILGCTSFPPLEESKASLSATSEHLFGAWENRTLVGVLAFDSKGGQTAITRLVVAPERFRQGVASFLLAHFIRNFGHGILSVATGFNNNPAIKIYKKHGFKIVKSWRSKEGILLVELLRQPM